MKQIQGNIKRIKLELVSMQESITNAFEVDEISKSEENEISFNLSKIYNYIDNLAEELRDER